MCPYRCTVELHRNTCAREVRDGQLESAGPSRATVEAGPGAVERGSAASVEPPPPSICATGQIVRNLETATYSAALFAMLFFSAELKRKGYPKMSRIADCYTPAIECRGYLSNIHQSFQPLLRFLHARTKFGVYQLIERTRPAASQ
jgi:hypothetical protein